jgi:ferritin-like metal-binding protein YciE
MAITQRLTNLWIEQLQTLYCLAIQLGQSLPLMERRAEHPEIVESLRQNGRRAAAHAETIEAILRDVGHHTLSAPAPLDPRAEWHDSIDDVEIVRRLRRNLHQEIARLAKAAYGARVLGYEDITEKLHAMMDARQRDNEALAKLGCLVHRAVQQFLAA